tara:strand:- start:250 stop:459 length:210 start_codon:yes stop_codon:yes gene_type:complete
METLALKKHILLGKGGNQDAVGLVSVAQGSLELLKVRVPVARASAAHRILISLITHCISVEFLHIAALL